MADSQGSDVTDRAANRISRRPFIKSTVAGAATVGLAGCTGGGGKKTQTTKQKTTDRAKSKFADAEFTWVDNNFFQMGSFAVKAMKSAAKAWEKETGGTINFRKQSVQELLTSFNNKNQPHLVTSNPDFIATAATTGIIRPYSSYVDQFPKLANDNPDDGYIPGVEEQRKRMWAPFDEEYTITIATETRVPFMGNMDHFRQTPGLDPKKDFPPKNLDHLIRVARKLDKEGPGKIGYQMIGTKGDMLENLWQLLFQGDVIADGEGGLVFPVDDWSKNQVNNKTWKKVLSKYFQIYKEHDIGAPNTFQINHEATVPMMLNEEISLSMQPADSHAIFVNRGGTKMFTPEGPLKWGHNFGGKTGKMAATPFTAAALPKAQPGRKQSKWRKKQEAAIHFLKFMMNSDVMTNILVSKATSLPAFQKPFNNMVRNDRTTAGNWLDMIYTTFEQTDGLIFSQPHPEYFTLKTKIIPKPLQESLRGNMTTEQALEKAHDEAQSYLDKKDHMWD